jgi:hypothetical protein
MYFVVVHEEQSDRLKIGIEDLRADNQGNLLTLYGRILAQEYPSRTFRQMWKHLENVESRIQRVV